jgi:hypothetical protein
MNQQPSMYTKPTILALLMLLFIPKLNAQTVSMNEVMAANISTLEDEDGDFEDWIELYNYGTTPVNLSGFGLSDDSKQPFKWIFPNTTLQPNAYLLVWASGKNRNTTGSPLHTNFNISSEGEELVLTAANGKPIDKLAPTPIPRNYSYGRLPNGTGPWHYYTATSPRAANGTQTSTLPPVAPAFSHNSGMYASSFQLTLFHPNPNARIYYTLDGSEPSVSNLSGISYSYKNQYPEMAGQAFGPLLTNTYQTNEYTEPLLVSDRSSKPNHLANISSTWHYAPDYFPKEPLKKATVVRALAVVDGVKSDIKTATYFVSGTAAFDTPLPIASISLNEDALFDYENGIYVAGKDFDNWRTKNPTEITNGHRSANYRREGIETEKAATFQYFVNGKEVLNQNMGLRLHGSFSTSFQNKTFRLYARSEYDSKSSFDYPFFGTGNSSSFKRLILRNSGNDAGVRWIGVALVHTISPAVYFRDALIQKMVSQMRMDTQDYMPVVTYVNGEYWGILNLRERYDEHYLERKYGIQESELELLEANAGVKVGSNDHYLMMRDFLSSNNMATNANYDYVKTLMDTENFMDYQIAEIYARNTDWPGNNIDYFRKKTTAYEPNAPKGQDGRWRWLLFDTDHGFGWTGGQSYTHNSLQSASNGSNWSTLILNKLLENPSFKNDFINRYADMLNTAFLPQRVIQLINEMAGNISDEIPSHQNRWNALPDWADNVELMRQFAQLRPDNARSHIRSRFKISRNITATLNVSDEAQGFIRINTIDINESTPGVAAHPYPWSGIYFQDVPITLTAVSKPGYQFSHWSGASTSTDASIALKPTGNLAITAHFIESENTAPELVYFWLFDNRIANDTPLEQLTATYPTGTANASISFVSSQGEGYPFTSTHASWRKGSMERRNAPTAEGYDPKGNADLPFGATAMKGIQIKEPFLSDGGENTLIATVSTSGYKALRLSFAAKDEGAVQSLQFDWYDEANQSWTSNGIVNANPALTPDFSSYAIDFSQVAAANNNPSFKIRIRFEGPNRTQDNDNRVTFNNFALYGTRTTGTSVQQLAATTNKMVRIFPNPATDRLYINVPTAWSGSSYQVHDLTGSCVVSGTLDGESTLLDVSGFARGVYVLNMEQAGKVYRIVKR